MPPDNGRGPQDGNPGASKPNNHGGAVRRNHDTPPPFLTDGFALSMAAAPADARGCTCDAEVTIRRDGNSAFIRVAHDDWCPVLAGAA